MQSFKQLSRVAEHEVATNHFLFTSIFTPEKTHGFLPKKPLTKLPESSNLHKELNRIATNLPVLINNKQLRIEIDNLNIQFSKTSDAEKILLLHNSKEKKLAMLMLTIITQAYIWESPDNPKAIIPGIIGNNLEYLAKSMQRFPILSYSDYILNNWYLINAQKGMTLDNIEPIFTLTGSVDEKWFIIIHLAIEATCAPAIHSIYEACLLNFEMNHDPALKNLQNDNHLISLLTNGITEPLREASRIQLKMKDHCNPEYFYHKLRPLLAGWDEKLGIRFAGNLKTRHHYKGPSGAQSSILPAFDLALCVNHQVDGMFQHLLTFKQYMPLKHQYFLNVLKLRSLKLKSSDSAKLITAANTAIQEVKLFRYIHLHALVDRFIYKPAANQGVQPDNITGTGGTPLTDYLSLRHDATKLSLAKL